MAADASGNSVILDVNPDVVEENSDNQLGDAGSRPNSVALNVNSTEVEEDFNNQLGDAPNRPNSGTPDQGRLEDSDNQLGAAGDNIPNCIDGNLYCKAAEGDFNAFEQHDGDSLEQLVTRFDKNTILHIYITSRIHYLKRKKTARVNESPDFVNEVLAKCNQLLWQPNGKGETILHIAARHGHDDIVEVLLTEDKDAHSSSDAQAVNRPWLLEMENKVGDTALHEAVRYSHLRVVNILIHEDRNYPYGQNNDGESPLYIAAEMGAREVVREILGACESPAYQGPDGRTALHAAVLCYDQVMVKLLLQKFRKQIITRKADKLGWTPLHYAAHRGYLPIVRLLLKVDKDAAYIADIKDKKTALHIAASRRKASVVKELMLACPDSFEQVDKNGRSVLHFAMDSYHVSATGSTLSSILENGYFSNLINAKDDLGNTPLHQAAISDSWASALLIHPKLNVRLFNKENLSPLDIISTHSNPSWRSTVMKGMLERIGERCSLRITNEDVDKDIGGIKDQDGSKKDELDRKTEAVNRNRRESFYQYLKDINLVVSILIATVTFAAGLTMPAGHVSANSLNEGSPVLRNKPAFKVFALSNAIAFILSVSAVFLHLSRRLYTRGTESVSMLSLGSNVWAMIAMVVAFFSGTCAVLAPSPSFATAICVLSAYLFLSIALEYPYQPSWMSWMMSEKRRRKLSGKLAWLGEKADHWSMTLFEIATLWYI